MVGLFFLLWVHLVNLLPILIQANLYLESASLFRSNVLKYHHSPEQFAQLAEKYASRILNRAKSAASTVGHSHSSITNNNNNLKNPNQATSTTPTKEEVAIDPFPRPFIIKTRPHCYHVCHHQLMDRFGKTRYDIINSQFGILTTTVNELQDFLHHSLTVEGSNQPSPVVDYAPFHPEMKISSDLRDIIMNLSQYCAQTTPKNKKLTIKLLVHGLSQEQYTTFHTSLTAEMNKYNGVLRLQYGFETFQEMSRLIFTIEIADCQLTETVLKYVANKPEVYWIEQVNPIVWHNRWSKGICDSGTTEVVPLDDWNITGNGEVIGISDTGIDLKNCYFYDPSEPFAYNRQNIYQRKVVYYGTTYGDGLDTTEGHGTHVSGIAAGLAYNNYGDYTKFQGMSHNAKIAFMDLLKGDSISGNINPPPGLQPMFNTLGSAGAIIFTNSWGTSDPSYDSYAVDVDTFMTNYPGSLILFSAGNSGQDGSYSVGSPATNKNGIAVGASLNDRESWQAVLQQSDPSSVYTKNSVAYFSSQGPTRDNRLKPDLLAPGYYVYSAKGEYNASGYHCDIQGLSGTSMASPTAAGFAVKVRQFYKLGYYPTGKKTEANSFNPSGALIKATLIHSGQKATYLVDDSSNYASLGSYPSTIQGYGRIQLSAVLNFGQSTTNPISMFIIGGATSSDQHYAALTATGQNLQYTFTTSSSSTQSPIRVTFCYSDHPGSASTSSSDSASAMINQLTLSVKSSASNTVLSPYSVSGTIQSNVQVIDIPSPTSSTTYTVIITANAINYSPQPIALVVTGQTTYLNATTAGAAETDIVGSTDVGYDTTNYIIVLAVIVFVLLVLYYYFYRISKENLLLDERNYGVYDPLDFDDGEGGHAKPTLFQRMFRSKK